jgi:hypothetical protein
MCDRNILNGVAVNARHPVVGLFLGDHRHRLAAISQASVGEVGLPALVDRSAAVRSPLYSVALHQLVEAPGPVASAGRQGIPDWCRVTYNQLGVLPTLKDLP